MSNDDIFVFNDSVPDEVKAWALRRNRMLKMTKEELGDYINSSIFNDYIRGYCALFLEISKCDSTIIEKAMDVSSHVFDFYGAEDALSACRKYR